MTIRTSLASLAILSNLAASGSAWAGQSIESTVKDANGNVRPYTQQTAADKFSFYVSEGNKLMRQKKYQEALRYFDFAVNGYQTNKEKLWALQFRLNALEGMQSYDKAVQTADLMLKLNPSDTDTIFKRGHFLLRLGKPQLAEADFDRYAKTEYRFGTLPFSQVQTLFKEVRLEKNFQPWLDRFITKNPTIATAYAFRATTYDANKNLDLAIKDLDNAIRIKPTADFFSTKASLYHEHNKKKESLATVDEGLKFDPKDSYLNYMKAFALLNEDKNDAALECVNLALKSMFERSSVHRLKGTILNNLDKNKEAEAEFQIALKQNPSDKLAYEGLIQAYSEEDKTDEQIKTASKGIELFPKTPFFWQARGLGFEDKKQYESAISDYSKAIELDEKRTNSYICRAAAYSKLKKYPEAKADLDKALALDPKNQTAHLEYAFVLVDSGEADKASIYIEKTVQLVPKKYSAWMSIGKQWVDRKNWIKAQESYEHARDENPDYACNYRNIANMQLELGKPDAALQNLQKCSTLKPEHDDHLEDLGILLYRMGNYAEAEKQYRALIAKSPEPTYSTMLGITLLKSGKTAEAKEILQKALTDAEANEKVAEPDCDTLSAGSQAATTLGNSNAARRLADRALAKDPKNSWALEALGDLEAAANNNEKAIEAYTKSLEVEDGNPDAMYKRAALYQQTSKPELAEKDFAECAKYGYKKTQ